MNFYGGKVKLPDGRIVAVYIEADHTGITNIELTWNSYDDNTLTEDEYGEQVEIDEGEFQSIERYCLLNSMPDSQLRKLHHYGSFGI